ncbi:aldehyde dehydrogenase family protein [Paludisphaera rhizosphaerae]|uniref:aldehyde dehydrogenase family protein n=1 Tax=Paludisphaera rhizosphaerae TaxID=2711216 RepID=UPI0013EA3809|nr:aldehyde dehydrogenase family protein [Paludisphaera rhizosphaerae]
MATATQEVLTTRNPATGEPVGRVVATAPDEVARVVALAREAQSKWVARPLSERLAFLDRWRAVLNRDAETLADLIRSEVGKPTIEAMAAEVVPTLDALRWTSRNARSALADERLGPSWQRMLLMPTGRLRWAPVGLVGMIGTWNYPLFLSVPAIAQALAAGCGMVWKPSELAIATGEIVQESLREAGLPEGLVGIVHGRGDVGQALLDAPIDKMLFTGGVPTGRQALQSVSARGIPGVVELSGFDPAVILPDAPLESTVRALVWGAFVGCGQTCVAVKRILVVGDPAPWIQAMAQAISQLRVGDPARPDIDIGPMISEAARSRFDRTIHETVEAGARIEAGGRPIEGNGSFYAPTLLSASSPEPERTLEGVFGPVVLIRGVATIDEAIAAANGSEMALAASVWGRDRSIARAVARRITAGTVSVNDAVTATGAAAAPFGGFKASGFGRTHGVVGLREFAAPQVLFERRAGGYRPQLFPYGASFVGRFLRIYRRLFHPQA